MSKYIENSEFLKELEKWRDSAEAPEERQPSEKLGEMLLKLHDQILKHKNFCRYSISLQEEMKSYSLFRILKCGLSSFDFQKTSPFSYFTRAVFQNYIQVINKYYKHINNHRQYIKWQLMKIDTHGDPHLEELIKRFNIGESEEDERD